MPFYEVTVRLAPKDAVEKTLLVEAANPAQAERYVAKDMIKVRLLNTVEIVSRLQSGAKLERVPK